MRRDDLSLWIAEFSSDLKLSKGARLVGHQIALRFAVLGDCEMSFSGLATAIGEPRTVAVRLVKELIQRGWLQKVGKSVLSNKKPIRTDIAVGPRQSKGTLWRIIEAGKSKRQSSQQKRKLRRLTRGWMANPPTPNA
jgi:hypothetical protein